MKPSLEKKHLQYYDDGAFDRARNIPEGQSLWNFLEAKMNNYPNIPAIEYLGSVIKREEFCEKVYVWAKSFKALGIVENEVVPIYGPFFPDICAMICALNIIGARSYCLKLSISKEALEQETSQSKVAIIYNGMWNNVKEVFEEDRFKKIIVASAADATKFPKKELLTTMDYITSIRTNSMIPKTDKYINVDEARNIGKHYTGQIEARFVKDRGAFITSSSGTSVNGIVKGTEATNEAAIAQLLQASNAGIAYPEGGRCLTNLPPTASTSLNCLFFLPLYMGMTVINEPRLTEKGFYDQLLSYKPQVALMTGSFWETTFRRIEKEMKSGKKYDFSFATMWIIGGEGLSPKALAWMAGIMKKCNVNNPFDVLVNGYGESEIFSVLGVEKPGKQVEDEHKEKPVISVGIPFPGFEVGIFDENDEELDYCNRGELRIKGPSIMKGYYLKEELTAKTKTEDGWIKSGDLAELDENGIIYYWGRLTDKIELSNGTVIYLFDIANKLRNHYAVKDVFVNKMPINNTEFALVAHVVLEENCIDIASQIFEELDAIMTSYLPDGLKIAGYKNHIESFISSPTTAKKDRNGLMKELTGYEKVVDGERYNISFIENNGTYELEYSISRNNNYTRSLKADN